MAFSHGLRFRTCRSRSIARRRFLGCPELLEDRRLLSLAVADYDQPAPAWFATVEVPYGPLTLSQAAVAATTASGTYADRLASPLFSPWIVRLTSESLVDLESMANVAQRLNVGDTRFAVVRGLGLPGQVLACAIQASTEDVEAALRANPHVSAFEPDALVAGEMSPDDPWFTSQIGLHNTGQDGGTLDADIDGPEAWNVTTGSRSVVVAVVDTGVDYLHPDLAANIWTNPGEIAGNGVDDDDNGFVDDVHGYDFYNHDGDPLDDNRHGTHVAGTIAAVGNNDLGVSGTAWSSSIMAVKFLDANNQGPTSGAIASINYVTQMRKLSGVNVRVINASWGGSNYSSALRSEIAEAGQADILFVAAAGNGDVLGRGIDNDETPFYPASYDVDNIIAVAASDQNDKLARFSNYGATGVDLAAPGVGIMSTEPGASYASRNGTSMAAPHVTGTAALLWSKIPYATAAEVRQAMLLGTDAKPDLAGKVASGGRLNAYGALTSDTVPPYATLVSAPDISGPGLEYQTIVVTFTDNVAVDVATLRDSNLTVTRLNYPGAPLPVSLVSVNLPSNGAVRTATYRVAAPGGIWDTLDNGTYEIALAAQEVRDTRQNTARAVVLGTFRCDVLTDGIYHVDTYADGTDINPGDGVCLDAAGHCSLRAAVQEANTSPGQITILLDAGTYRLSIPGQLDDQSSSGDLDVLGQLTIVGVGAAYTIIDADALDRVLDVHPGAALHLSDLTVAGGNGGDEAGGGIRNHGELTLDHVTVTRCFAGSALVPVGAERPVAASSDAQQFSDIAVDAAGNRVVVWLNRGVQDTFFGQRYAADGSTLGSAFAIGDPVSLPADMDWRPLSVAMNAAGNFVIAWTGADADGLGIVAQRYGADGTALGARIVVNSTASGDQVAPSVSINTAGDFVVAWEDQSGRDGDGTGVYLQRHRAGGTRIGGQTLVNAVTSGAQQSPAIALDDQGQFLVSWESENQDGSGSGVFARWGSLDTLLLDPELRVNTRVTGDQRSPAVAVAADGQAVVVWQSEGQDGDDWGVYAQRYETGGTAEGAEFLVNATTADDQIEPSVAMGGDGAFFVVWTGADQDGDSTGVFARGFDSGGHVRWAEFTLGQLTAGDQRVPDVAISADGSVVMAWQGAGGAGDSSVFVRGYVPRWFDHDGGGILNSASMTITASTLCENRSGGDGGGLFNAGAATITASTINANSADGQGAATIEPAGNEALVNAFVTGIQQHAVVAADAAGNYVVVWESDQDGTTALYGQRFDAVGSATNNFFRISDPGAQPSAPAVTMNAGGDFVVVWQDDMADGDGAGIRAKYFNADGRVRSAQFLVNASAPGSQTTPVVSMDAAGRFLVAWVDGAAGTHIDARWFDALARPLSGDVLVSNPSYAASAPAVASAPDGRAVVAWQSTGEDGDGDGAYFQRFDSHRVAQGDRTRVHAAILGDQQHPAVAMRENADFVVAWQDRTLEGNSTYGIFARQSSWTGSTQGETVPVNSYTAGDQTLPSVTVDAAGGFSVAWLSTGQDGNGGGVYSQRFDFDGARQGTESRASTTTAGEQTIFGNHALVASASGQQVVVWSGNGPGDDQGILAQRYALTRPSAGNGGGVANCSMLGLTNATLSGNTAAVQGGGLFNASSAVSASSTNCTITANLARGEVQRSQLEGGPTQFRVDPGKVASDGTPRIAMDSAGNYVVAFLNLWVNYEIYAKRYSSAGVPLTGFINVNGYGTLEPAMGMDGRGNFIVAWTYDREVRARLYQPDGTPGSGPILVADFGYYPAVGMAPDGSFLIAWWNGTIDAQLFDATRAPLGDPFSVSQSGGNLSNAEMAVAPNGEYLITWQNVNQAIWGGPALLGRRLSALGEPLGDEFFVGVGGATSAHQAAFDQEGNFVIVWNDDNSVPAHAGIYARRFNAAGAPLGDRFQVSTWTSGMHKSPSIAMEPDSDFVVVWQVADEDGSGLGVFGRRFNGFGQPLDNEFQVNMAAEGDQYSPDIAMGANGNFVVVFNELNELNGLVGIMARHFSAVVYDGGGVYSADGGTVDMLNTLVAGNTGPHLSPDVAGTFTSLGHNLLGELGNTTGFDTGTGGSDLVDADAQDLLGALTDNGGPTWTHALLAGSSAIDAGTNVGAPATDQRGVPRPQDANGDDQADCDVGAFEIYHGEISGSRFHDLDGDGERDTDEPGLSGLAVYLDLDHDGALDPGEPSTTTLTDDPQTSDVDETGTYILARLTPGEYTLAEVLEDGWEATSPDSGVYQVTVTPGLTITDKNFANRPRRGQIGGLVFDDADGDTTQDLDEPGLADWTVFLDINENGRLDGGEPTETTGTDGRYAFVGLEPLQTYTVLELPAEGWEQSWPGEIATWRWQIDLGAGQVFDDADFANRYVGASGQTLDGVLKGRVFLDSNGDGQQGVDEPGIVGRIVYLDQNDNGVLDAHEPTTVTFAADPARGRVAGDYQFPNLPGGTYVVRLMEDVGTRQTAPVGNDFALSWYSTGDGPQSVVIADVDGDDLPDLAVANAITNNISVLFGQGGGTFAAAQNLPTGYGATAIVALDLSGDDIVDVAVGNLYAGTVSILKGRGDGTFAAAANVAINGAPRAMTAIDFDHDGDEDLAVVDEYQNRLVLLENDGQGNFALGASCAVGSGPSAVVVSHLNDDNDNGQLDAGDWLDLVVANFDADSVSVLKGQSGGTFAAAVSYAAGNGPFSVAAGDLDADGDTDLSVADVLGNSVALLRNRGDGTFLSPLGLAAGKGPSAVTLGDLDGDGDADLLVTNGTSQDLSVIRNRGGWSFEPAEEYGVGDFPTSLPFSVAAGDLDGDAILDVIVANGQANNVSVLLNALVPGAHRASITGTQTASGLHFAVVVDPVAHILGHSIFYNNSSWDGNNKAADAADDAAIAVDKSALLPGTQATLANYTSYSRGINGIMIDIAGLAATPTVDDFQFRIGNSNNVAAWAPAPAPTSITVREGAGVDGADRVTLIWADNAIQQCWLQVTVLATDATGLAQDYVFYFGNAIGESGDSLLNMYVNALDEIGARNNPHGRSNLALVDDRYDYNRDKYVNALDEIIARNNPAGRSNALVLFTPPGGGGGEGEGDWTGDSWVNWTDGSDGVTLIWTDRDIRNCWLQVTVLATVKPGLAQKDDIFVGTAAGEARNCTTDAGPRMVPDDSHWQYRWHSEWHCGTVGPLNAADYTDRSTCRLRWLPDHQVRHAWRGVDEALEELLAEWEQH